MTTIFCIRPRGFNVGNDAIFLGLQIFLYEAFGEVVNLISIPATSRYESQAQAGLTARTIYEINQYGHGVVVGGGNLYENGELELDLEALEALEVPLMLFSLSRGRIYNRHHKLVDRTDAMPRRLVEALHRKARRSLARDRATLSFLHKIGCENAVLGGCPSLFLERLAGRLPRLAGRDEEAVLVSVRNPALMSVPLRDQARVADDVRAILAILRDRGHSAVRLVCHDHRDIPFAASFQDVDYVYTGDVYVYLAMLRSAALVVSYRLHAGLPSLAFGTPFVAISYDERGFSGLEMSGLAEWDINMILAADVGAEVASRLDRLEDFERLREAARPRWQELDSTNREAFRRFAADVTAYRGGGGDE